MISSIESTLHDVARPLQKKKKNLPLDKKSKVTRRSTHSIRGVKGKVLVLHGNSGLEYVYSLSSSPPSPCLLFLIGVGPCPSVYHA